MTAPLTRKVHEAAPADAGRGIVRVDPADLKALGVSIGDLIAIHGQRAAFARAMPAQGEHRGLERVLIDGSLRASAGASVGDEVRLAAASAKPAEQIGLALGGNGVAANAAFLRQVKRALDGVPLAAGSVVKLRLIGGRELSATVTATRPEGPVLVGEGTEIAVTSAANDAEPTRSIAYEDLGGLGRELARVREMIELPLRRPDIFAHLGIEAPKGLLLSGPPGTGKTLIARAVAEETNAAFFQINGPEIIGKHYGESEQLLRDIFKRAEAKAPAIVFIDEIDAIAPKREALNGDRQVERRIVAQLLTLLDGLAGRGHVIVIAATNIPDSLDPALRRPGRFDREIVIGVPDRAGRREILQVHLRGMPLADDVEIDALAGMTHGYVGADLAALCREAGMAALRRSLDLASANLTVEIDDIRVTRADFESAFNDIRPSAVREVHTDVPDVKWTDVAGVDTIRDALIEAVVWPLTRPGMYERFGIKPRKGVLLTGAPGTGKTLLAKALATEAKVNFISVRGPQLLNQFVGESERAVRAIFAKARQVAPAILFFDEIDALVPVRGGGDGAALERVVAQFLTELDGIEELKNVFLLAATNRVDRVDPALLRPGRFDLTITMPLPEASARADILAIHLRAMPLAEDVNIAALAEATDGFVGASLAGLAQTAGLKALRRCLATGEEAAVTQADFAAALQEMWLSMHAAGTLPAPFTDRSDAP
jgi:transitional endoplasmic reticulum ATPase